MFFICFLLNGMNINTPRFGIRAINIYNLKELLVRNRDNLHRKNGRPPTAARPLSFLTLSGKLPSMKA
jgi:hypothetical protein